LICIYLQAHPGRTQYLNKLIENYDELWIICEEDMATEEFTRTNCDTEKKNEPGPINLNDDMSLLRSQL